MQTETCPAPTGNASIAKPANPERPSPHDSTTHLIWSSLTELQRWVEGHDYKGYEPFDGLSSWARPLAFGNLFAERLLMQGIRQCPINLRPLFGVPPKDSTKGRGYMAWGYLALYQATNRRQFLDKATACLRWLDEHKVPRFKYHSWSNHFDFVSRGGRYTKDDPIIVWTALIGQAFIEAYEVTGDPYFLTIADSICHWIMELPRERTERGDCLSYLVDRQSTVHNANMLGAALLARVSRHTGNKDYRTVSESAMTYSCSRQLEDGAWWYAEEPKFHWFDNFHTGYNLDSLKCYIDHTGDKQYLPHLQRGMKFFKDNFFETDGCPKYYHDRRYPVDIQCAAQAIETFATFSDTDPECLDMAIKVARWTIENMQDPKGFFYYRRYPMMTAKTPMLHWGQGTTFRGLSVLYSRLLAPSATHA